MSGRSTPETFAIATDKLRRASFGEGQVFAKKLLADRPRVREARGIRAPQQTRNQMVAIEHRSAAPQPFVLGPGDVHVWSVELRASTAAVETLAEILSHEERTRAALFHFVRDRRRFIGARGALRNALASYLGAAPAELAFTYGLHGKPALGGPHRGALSFNVSHSHDLALIAVAGPDRDVGVDVEKIESMPDWEDIACRFFAPNETARLRALPLATRARGFFQCWTRKEAYLKALGDGLARPLEAFEVTFGIDEPFTLRVIDDQDEARRWDLAAWDAAPDYVAALVASCGVARIICWPWRSPP